MCTSQTRFPWRRATSLLRFGEYIWADDIPIAVFDTVATSPTLYLVHTDHLMRPVRMTNQWGGLAWDVLYRPFGEVNNISEIATTSAMRFPGQWFNCRMDWPTTGTGITMRASGGM